MWFISASFLFTISKQERLNIRLSQINFSLFITHSPLSRTRSQLNLNRMRSVRRLHLFGWKWTSNMGPVDLVPHRATYMFGSFVCSLPMDETPYSSSGTCVEISLQKSSKLQCGYFSIIHILLEVIVKILQISVKFFQNHSIFPLQLFIYNALQYYSVSQIFLKMYQKRMKCLQNLIKNFLTVIQNFDSIFQKFWLNFSKIFLKTCC